MDVSYTSFGGHPGGQSLAIWLQSVFCDYPAIVSVLHVLKTIAMLGSPRLVQLLKLGVPFLVVVWLLGSVVTHKSAYGDLVRQFQDEKELFISDFLKHEIDGDFDGHAIAELCASKKWTPGLILSCQPAPGGGVGQIKNAHLSCIRFAMEMGGEDTIQLPLVSRAHRH